MKSTFSHNKSMPRKKRTNYDDAQLISFFESGIAALEQAAIGISARLTLSESELEADTVDKISRPIGLLINALTRHYHNPAVGPWLWYMTIDLCHAARKPLFNDYQWLKALAPIMAVCPNLSIFDWEYPLFDDNSSSSFSGALKDRYGLGSRLKPKFSGKKSLSLARTLATEMIGEAHRARLLLQCKEARSLTEAELRIRNLPDFNSKTWSEWHNVVAEGVEFERRYGTNSINKSVIMAQNESLPPIIGIDVFRFYEEKMRDEYTRRYKTKGKTNGQAADEWRKAFKKAVKSLAAKR